MEEIREKQTDWTGTVKGFVKTVNTIENEEGNEKSYQYQDWRKENQAVLLSSDANVKKLEKSTSTTAKTKNKEKGKITTSTKKQQEIKIGRENAKKVGEQQKSIEGIEIGE